jgi:DegT/DnrJ/EryC1/StrS aminotransferase family protein
MAISGIEWSQRVPSENAVSRELESMFPVARAINVGRGAVGLWATLQWWRRNRSRNGRQCRVALPGAICHDVIVAILAAGCEPVFCDVDVADGLVKESEWARARVCGADVAIVVHLYGNPARASAARAAFPSPDCLVIDDAAQALGARNAEGFAGTLGDVGLLSFTMNKHLPLGNAALLFQNEDLAEGVRSIIDSLSWSSVELRESIAAAFRSRLNNACAVLRKDALMGARAFSGLLQGMEPMLYAPASGQNRDRLVAALKGYSVIAAARIAKANLWASRLSGTSLHPVGMGAGSVPWRYVCRLSGIDWAEQHRLAEAMRAADMHVSNWYFPAHWFLGHPLGMLPGVETLSREVFQFWVDAHTSQEAIVRGAEVVKEVLSSRAT